MKIKVYYYTNPQLNNNIKLITDELTNDNAYGILVKNYKPKYMELPKLNTSVHKKLKKNVRNSGNILTKPLSVNETWQVNNKLMSSNKMNN